MRNSMRDGSKHAGGDSDNDKGDEGSQGQTEINEPKNKQIDEMFFKKVKAGFKKIEGRGHNLSVDYLSALGKASSQVIIK